MPRRAENLPPGISRARYPRKGYQIRYSDPSGKWRTARAATLDEAKRKKRRLEDGSEAQVLTLNSLAARWEREQREAGRRNVDRDARRYWLHASPILGDRLINELRAPDFVRVLRSLPLKAKSVQNVRGVLSSMFALAVYEGLVEVNPVGQIPRGKLQKTGQPARPRYTAEEAIMLMTDPRIEPAHRVINAIEALTGMRIGEVCGRKWKDYDPRTKPLGTLRVHTQYGELPLKTASGEDVKARYLPVHPHLETFLRWWRDIGFEQVFDRAPTPEDYIVPDPASMGARTQSQATKGHKRDAELVGIYRPGRCTHGLRRFFISHARQGGARQEILERITHNRRGDIIDVYTSFEWGPLCEVVLCVRLDLPDGASPKPAANEKGVRLIVDNSEPVAAFVANDSFTIRKAGESSGGGGNRKHQISRRFSQLQVITGNRILSWRKRKTAKSTFGKTFCQVAKSNSRRCREGRTWETCPPPRA